MPQADSDGVALFYEETGGGESLVLVHGSWNDHNSWTLAIEADLRASCRVITYDRRGHGRSGDAPGQGTRRQDEDDLAAVIEQVASGHAHVAGNSFGASIVLGLAARRPELFRSILVHEPPLVGIVGDDAEALAGLQQMLTATDAVLDHLRKNEDEPGARLFVEEIALGCGMWDQMPDGMRQTFVRHAQTWLDEQQDPCWAELDLGGLAARTTPLLLSSGTESPAWFRTVLDRIASAVPRAQWNVFTGAGHIPHVTHPQDYATALTRFIRDS
ncbi:alpha/beta fold hydrolase [Streptomyces sp. NPDC051563]|uniref:alpha/beta fold hydrolase n=1 Tax=Streptomyces sp. NPDC051563 TaxID=3365659 RepID=UPI00378B70B9